MNKGQRKGTTDVNEQKIEKKNNNNCCWECPKDRKEK
jgi:hypothetical protein